LWSRLILHFWALEAEKDAYGDDSEPDPVKYLEKAYRHTVDATSKPNEWFGTTTACGALLHTDTNSKPAHPILYVTQLGDSQILVIRPEKREVIYKTTEQWHWFDCPRQLGTNSPDVPDKNAVMDKITIAEDDIILAMSDGVVEKWQSGSVPQVTRSDEQSTYAGGMQFVAQELVKAARTIAQDPFAESPYMERAIEEGLSIEGGKLDDISVVAAVCKKRIGR
jgi:serine/threonine protein phosphatase PrpC